MRKRVHIALAVLLVALGGVIGWQVLSLREPVCEGKRLSFWLRSYSSDGDSPVADEALRTIGTNAIPALLAMLQAKDSTLKMKLVALGLRYTPAETCHMRAEKASAH